MFARALASRLPSIQLLGRNGRVSQRCMSAQAESDSEFDKRYEAYFNRADIDGWEIRKGMADLVCMEWCRSPPL
jgi:cytochrome c oxidase subunit 5a